MTVMIIKFALTIKEFCHWLFQRRATPVLKAASTSALEIIGVTDESNALWII